MEPIDTTVIIGTCAPARQAYSQDLALGTGDALWASSRLRLVPDPIDEGLSLIPWLRIPNADPNVDAILEFPASVPASDIVTRFSADEGVALRRVVCVVDAAHLFRDLSSEEYLPQPLGGGEAVYTAAAAITATQVEHCTHIALIDTERLSHEELSRSVALVHVLAPSATVFTHALGSPKDSIPDSSQDPQQLFSPGWAQILDGMELPSGHPGVTASRWSHPRPFHPQRLFELLEERVETGEFGQLIRSAGLATLCTRPSTPARWNQVSNLFSFEPCSEREPGATLGQDLALIGLDLDSKALHAALDDAVLTDEEFLAGPETWLQLPDPFPAFALGSR